MKGVYYLLAVIMMTSRAHGLVYEDCSIYGEIHSLEIEGCPAPPCRLLIGTTPNMTVQFRTDVAAVSLKEKAYFMITEVEQDARIVPNACAALTGAFCPLAVGDVTVYKAQAIITADYPPVKGDFVWMLRNEQDNTIVCFAVAVRLAYNQYDLLH